MVGSGFFTASALAAVGRAAALTGEGRFEDGEGARMLLLGFLAAGAALCDALRGL